MAPAAPSPTDYSSWSVGDLEAEQARLAAHRTVVREAQVAVGAELEIRAALERLSEPARRIVRVRLEGAVRPEGATSHA